MKILFLSDNFFPETNAPATRLYEHSVRWAKSGHAVTVVTSAPNFPQGKVYEGYKNAWRRVEMIDGVKVVRVKTYITANEGFLKRTLDYMSFMVSSFLFGLFEEQPDLIVATSPQFFTAIGGWALSKVRGLPFVLELRDLWPATILAVGAINRGRLYAMLEWVELFLYRQATAVIPVTKSFKNDLVLRGIDAKKIFVVLNGVDLSRYQPRAEKDPAMAKGLGIEGKFVVGYLGTHGMCHGLEFIVEAAEQLRTQADIVFLFAGAGAEKQMLRAAVNRKVLKNVIMLNAQPKERMPALWSVCDLALIPLRDDQLFTTVIPSKLFECMGMGVPIVMSLPKGEATGIMENEGAGVSVPPENPGALTEAILNLKESPEKLKALREASKRAASRYSRDTFANQMIHVFEIAAKA